MIPKIIHYCWFGRNQFPTLIKRCIESWNKLLPEYKQIRWDEDSFDVNSVRWTREAYEHKKYAFVADFVRLYALYEYGGIYLDTDVEVLKPLDSFLKYSAFTGFENADKLTSAILGSVKHNSIIKEFLENYHNKSFIKPNGELDMEPNVIMMTNICLKYGLVLNNDFQLIKDLAVFPDYFFCPFDFYLNDHRNGQSCTIHYFTATWLNKEERRRVLFERSAIIKVLQRVRARLSSILKRH